MLRKHEMRLRIAINIEKTHRNLEIEKDIWKIHIKIQKIQIDIQMKFRNQNEC